jgi:GDP-D-mannose dehydratase
MFDFLALRGLVGKGARVIQALNPEILYHLSRQSFVTACERITFGKSS